MRALFLEATIIIFIFLGLVGFAKGHGWYDYDCCTDEDCRPAQPGEVREEDGGYRVVPTGEHFSYDSGDARPSHDGRYHVCQYQTSSGQYQQSPVATVTRCVYFSAPGV